MIDRTKAGLMVGAVAAAAVIAGLAGAQTPSAPIPSPAPAASAAPAAKGCCQGKGGAAHDHAKCAMHEGDAAHDHAQCPMHAEKAKKAEKGTAEKKDGEAMKCPFAGARAAADTAGKDSTKDAKAAFACPMHPEITSDKKDRCPKCGMFLEEKR